MRKTAIAISVLLFSVTCFATENVALDNASSASTPAPIELNKQYIELPTLISPEKEVIEFFSFNCPSCFRFEVDFHGVKTISETLPEGVKFKRYHLDNFGPLAPELAEAWAIANVLGVQDKITEPFYNAIQRDRTLKTADDIKAIFASIGVDNDTFDKTKNNFLVNAFMAQQAEALKELQPSTIPTVVVNRKYYINPQGLNNSSSEAVIEDYARVATYLVDMTPKAEPAKETKTSHNKSSQKSDNKKANK